MAYNYNLGIIINARNNATSVLNSIRDQMAGIGESSARMGQTLKNNFGKYAIAAGAAAIGSIKFAGDFEKSMNNIDTLFSDGGKQIKEYSAGIKEIIKNSPKSAQELGSSAYDIISAGITDTKVALDTLQASSDLATAGLSSTGEATGILTSSINAFSKQGYSANQISNILFKTVKNGKTTVSELAQGFGGIAGLASTVGIQFDELMSATAALTTTGLPASEVYTSLKAAISNIMKPSSEAAKLAKSLGIEFSAASLKSKGFKGILQEIKEKTNGNVDTMGKLFGSVEALNAVLGLTGSNADAFTKTLANMKDGQDDLSVAVEKQNEGFNNQVSILKNQLQVAMIGVGQAILPVIQSINKFAKEHTTLTKIIVGGVLVIGGLLAVLGTLGFAITGITGLMSGMSGAFAVATPIIAATGTALKALFLNPVGLVIAAVALLGYGIYRLITDFEGVKKSIGDVGKAFQIQGTIWQKVGKILLDAILLPIKSIAAVLDILTGTEFSLKISGMEESLLGIKQLKKETEELNTGNNVIGNSDVSSLNNSVVSDISNISIQDRNGKNFNINLNMDKVEVRSEEDIEKITEKIKEKLSDEFRNNSALGI